MSSTDPRLVELLGATPPSSVSELSAADQAKLVQVVASARRKQTRDLAESFDAALKHVPFPVRGIVKKTLLG